MVVAKSSVTGTPIVVDTDSLARLSKDIRAVSPAAWKGARVGLRAAGQVIATEAKSRAAFSSRIPKSIVVRTTALGNVKVQAGGEAAPDAAAIENRGKGFVRHPTFSPRPSVGQRVGWTSLNSKPAFLAPALSAKADQVAVMVLDALEEAVTKALRGS